MESTKCEPCQTRGNHEISVTKCVDCDEALCATCTDNHRSMKALRNHQLVDVKSLPAQLDFGTQTCIRHKNLAFEYFCIDHDLLCCKECLAEIHRKCLKVMSIDIASKGCKQSQTVVDSSELLTGVSETIRAFKNEKTNNKETIEREAEDIEVEITKAKVELLKRIDMIEKQLLKELDEKKQKSLGGIHTQLGLIKELEENTIENMKRLDFVTKYGNDRQAFIFTHSNRKELNNIESNLEDIVQDSDVFKLEWKPKLVNNEHIFFGSVQQTACKSTVKCVSKKKIQSQVPMSRVDETAFSFAFESKLDLQSVGGARVEGIYDTNDSSSLLLCDKGYRRLLVYSKACVYQFSIGLKHKPWDVVQIPGTTSVVVTPAKDEDECLQIMSLSSDGHGEVKTKNMAGITMAGIAVNDINIFVGGANTLLILDYQCNLQRRMSNFHRGYLCSICLCDNNSDNIWFSDGVKINCSSFGGYKVTTYKSSQLEEPRTIAKDKHGYLYVCGRKSNNIHRLKADGTFVDIVLDEKNDISNPLAVCFDRNYKKMYVSNKNGIEVLIFNVT